MEGEAKTRTFSCSTEESGLESGPPSSSCSSPPSPPVGSPCSEGELSETSDYPRQSPSPASEGESTNNNCTNNESTNNLMKRGEQQQVSATRNRRATVPPHGNLLRVSLHKLPRATVHNDINSKLDKVVLQAELRTGEGKEEEPARVKHENSESKLDKLEGMKLEMAKLESILHGNLLLDKSSHKISDMLLLDSLESQVKQDYGRDRSSISSQEPARIAVDQRRLSLGWLQSLRSRVQLSQLAFP